MPEFKEGDIVQLNSGGPKMTVIELNADRSGVGVGPDDGIRCTWFDEKNKQSSNVFTIPSIRSC